MSGKSEIMNAIHETGVIAVLRSESEEQALAVTRSCMAGGIKVIEITFSTPGADDVIKRISRDEDYSGAIVGAGTVLDVPTARLAIVSGAKFIVAPTFDSEVAKTCNLYGIPYIPGTMTINEIVEALKYGVETVKLFPASEYKPGFIKAVHGPIPQVDITVTGGVSLANTAEWIAAGAVAVGIGGNLAKVPEGAVLNSEGLYDSILEAAAAYLEQVRIGRS